MTPTMEDIKQQFKKIIQYSQNFQADLNLDSLFSDWLDAKREIIEAWGGKYIYELPGEITFHLDEKEKRKRLMAFSDVVSETYNNNSLANFIWDRQEDFFSNILSNDYRIADGKIIPKGTKIIRAFKYFEDDAHILADLQNQASMIVQEDKITGTLCYSVHPIDFLSASENTYNWRSCHALDGDYRAGNLSYMLDKNTIICYLKGKEDVQLPNFPEGMKWNNKKWRMLLFLSDNWNAMFAGRQYPFSSPTALNLVKENLLALLNLTYPNYWTKWYNDRIDTFPRSNEPESYLDADLDDYYISMNGQIYNMSDLVTDPKNALHFNDLTKSTCYTPYYCWNRRRAHTPIHFTIGHDVKCLCCSKNKIIYPSSIICEDCDAKYGEGENDSFTYCGCCQRRTRRDNMFWVNGLDAYVCESCKDLETKKCDICHDRWYSCDITYDRDRHHFMCPNCLNGKTQWEF